MNNERVIVRFNRSSLTPSPYDARVEIFETGTGTRIDGAIVNFDATRN